MRLNLALACLACAIAATPAAAQRPRSDESWGKPGISFLQYRTEAVECAYVVGQEAPVDYPLVDLIFPGNMPGQAAGGDDIYIRGIIDQESAGAHMSRPWREITRQLRPALTQCLSDRGYRRFRLTRDQERELKTLPTGSRGRQVYLWNLAIDPEVQRRQALRR
jgi:hypothetical protein